MIDDTPRAEGKPVACVTAKKRYVRPAILSRERLESVADVCSSYDAKSPGGLALDGMGECGYATGITSS